MPKKVKEYQSNYLVKQLPTSTAFFDKKLRLLHASDRWINDFELNLNTIFGKNIYEIFKETDTTWRRRIKDCLAGKVYDSFTKSFNDSHDNKKWFEWDLIPWYNDEEDIIGIIINTKDVSQIRQKEKDFILLQSLLKEKSEIAKIGSWIFDLATNEVTWCDMTKTIHEVPLDFVPNVETGIEFYKQGHSRNTISLAVSNAITKGTEWNEKLQIITATGKEKWIIAAGKPLYKNGEVVSIFGTFQDIDSQVTTSIEVSKNERLLKTVLDNLPLNVFIKDLDSKKVLVNKAECDYLGVDGPESLLGKDDFDLYPKEHAQISRNEDLAVMDSRTPMIGQETTSVKEDGTSTTFLTSKIPLFDIDNAVTGLVGISMDITELKQKEEDLKNLMKVTTEQNNKLINFAHIVSHNLRSHSANFSMLLGFLESEKDAEERKSILSMLVTASDNLLETLENLNDVVSINTNTSLNKTPVVLRDRIEKIGENLSAFLQNNNAKVINRVSDEVSVSVIPAYLDSILMNFITNGIKYKEPTRDPVIELWVIKSKNSTVLSIKDNGLGIDLKKHGEKLFGMYKTFHSNPDARGIGLYITKNQIEAMNGKVTATSEVGKGTTFNIFFNEND
ncbi:PAS domain-containing sensor histidine kinase [Aggregatimonas sangjinii]|uniref:PAS domain-containing sensor histidine kinase n=1 Tax=Aggregatimonas sangjinii TaxID=2583587 RepID=UPI001F42B9CA|nr:PAS domain-containing sensor histidine kinase [Aggregatimonas sangjinii]